MNKERREKQKSERERERIDRWLDEKYVYKEEMRKAQFTEG